MKEGPRAPKKPRRRRRSFRFTREGKVFVAVTIGVGLAAVNTGNNLLYLVLGLLLSLLLVSGMLSDLALWRIRIERHLPLRAFAHEPALFEIHLRNGKGRLPSYAIEVEDLAQGEKSAARRCFFLKVGPGGEQRAIYRRTPPRRGRLVMETLFARTRYPFGLIEKGQRHTLTSEMIVFPRLQETRNLSAFGPERGDDQPTRRPGPGTEILGLRDHREGDEARSVHWRRSASLDRLIVRESARASRGRLTLIVDRVEPEAEGPPSEAWLEAFEEAVSEAATLARRGLADGMSVEVLVQGERSPLLAPGAAPDEVWRYLALLESIPALDAPPWPTATAGSTVVHVRTAEKVTT